MPFNLITPVADGADNNERIDSDLSFDVEDIKFSRFLEKEQARKDAKKREKQALGRANAARHERFVREARVEDIQAKILIDPLGGENPSPLSGIKISRFDTP